MWNRCKISQSYCWCPLGCHVSSCSFGRPVNVSVCASPFLQLILYRSAQAEISTERWLFFLSPFFSIFPSADQDNTTTLIPATHNTGGSLPDLTNIHFPSPLPTPLDPEESTFPALSSSNSTGNLAANLTHLGISTATQGKVWLCAAAALVPPTSASWPEAALLGGSALLVDWYRTNSSIQGAPLL